MFEAYFHAIEMYCVEKQSPHCKKDYLVILSNSDAPIPLFHYQSDTDTFEARNG